MARQLLMTAVVVGTCVLSGVHARAQVLYAHLFPLTGEIRLRSKDSNSFPFAIYSITSKTSKSGALNSSPGVWRSITDNYDVSGNGFIDPTTNWTKISAAGSTTELSEGVFSGPGGVLPAMRSLSLGRVWNPSVTPWTDLQFDIRKPGGEPISVWAELALDGDYIPDKVVTQLDYSVWRSNFGSTSFLLPDGNINGRVDAADYVVWRDNLGKSIQSFGAGSTIVGAAAIPEPATGALLVLALSQIAILCRSATSIVGHPRRP